MRDWAVRCLYWIVLFYPLHMAAVLLLHAAPALVRHWAGDPIVDAFISPTQVFVMHRKAESFGPRGPAFGLPQAAMAVAVLGAAAFLRRRFPTAAPLLVAASGLALGGNWAMGIFFNRSISMQAGLLLALSFALLAAGLSWAVRTARGGYANRAALIAIGFALPAAILPAMLGFGRGGPRPFWPLATAGLLPLLAAFVAPFAARAIAVPAAAPTPLRAIAAAAMLSFALGASVEPLRRSVEGWKHAEVRATLAALPKPDPTAPYVRDYFHRGVNFTALGFGYTSPRSRDLLEQLPPWGIADIALVPYGGADRRTLRMSPGRAGSWEADDGIEILTAVAHKQGMRVMLKPHVWKPSEADLATDERRGLWFAEFGKFIEHYARLAQRVHADTLCIGTEFGWLTRYEQPWREIIARVRSIYAGPLVYASNHGPEFESIRFWDALDYIGIDNYYPLGTGYSTAEMLARIEAVAQRFNKPVLFTETGYSSAPGAHRTPWDDKRDGPVSLEEQVRCYEALLAAFYHRPWFRGIYWWKIETNGIGGEDHPGMVPWRKPAMEVIRSWFLRKRPDSL